MNGHSTSSSTTTNTRFTVPPDFEEIECSTDETLLIDDLQNEDHEAWLIKIPADVSLENLKGQKIKLNKKTKLELNDSKQYECSVTSAKEVSSLERFNIVVPRAGLKKFTSVPIKFEGHISISNYSQRIPRVNLEELEKERMDSAALPLGLRQRLKPFGAGSPEKRKRESRGEKESPKKKKKNDHHDCSPIKTKKKKRKTTKEINCDDTNDLSDEIFE